MKTLLIMAAGNGSRYGALKQFDNLGPEKEFLFEYSIFDAIESGFDHIVVITKREFVTEISSYLQKRLPKNIKIDVIEQVLEDLPKGTDQKFDRLKPWGTAHAVWSARNHIKNGFAVLNADDFYGKGAFEKAAEFLQNNKSDDQYGLVSYYLNDTLSDHGTVSRGICEAENDQLLKISELLEIGKNKDGSIIDFNTNTNLTGEEPTSMNFWICYPSFFEEIEKQFTAFLKDEQLVAKGELYIPLAIQKMIENKLIQVKLTAANSTWFGVTHAADKEMALKILKQKTDDKQYPTPLWKI